MNLNKYEECNKYLLSFLTYANDRADGIYREIIELYRYALKAITEIILEAMEDWRAYSTCREFSERGVLLPVIIETEIMKIVRNDRGIYIPVFEETLSCCSSERVVYTRKSREFGFSVCSCKLGPEDSFRTRLSPYLGEKSAGFTQKEIDKKFLDKEFGKTKMELEKTHVCERDLFVYRGKKIAPAYDANNRLIAVKQ